MKSENVKNKKETALVKQIFFFPKANPPRSVEAESLEEALKIINNIK